MAAKYLTMVGQLQWLVTLGRLDLHAQVATMSGSFLLRENAWRIFSIMVIFVLTSAKIEPHVRIFTFSLSYFGK